MKYAIGYGVMLAFGMGATQAQAQAQNAAAAGELDEIIVSATRTKIEKSAIPNTIEIISPAELSRQSKLSGSAVEAVANFIPSFAPTREKLSGAGESLRGRSPLYLIDSVPQSNPLRDGSRDGYTIDPFFIDRVEVIFGSNAIQGIGATGGVVNYVTVDAPDESEGWTGRVLSQISVANEFQGDGTGYRFGALGGRDFGTYDAVAGFAVQTRGAFYSGDGRRIGVDGTQGEVQDSFTWSGFGKFGIDLTPERRVELMVQHFDLKGDGDYVQVPGSRANGIPSTSIRGTTPGEIPTNLVTTVSLNYEDGDLWNGTFIGQLFYQDFESVFGGGTFATFQDPTIDPTNTLFDQSSNNSQKMGFRMSYEREIEALPGFRFIAGFDGLRDKTYQELVQTGRNWVPETKFTSLAPFLQFHQSLWDGRVHLSGGLRQEFATLKVDDYETLYVYGPQMVGGGSPSFERTLFNVGATFEVVEGLTAYASYAEGFTMADVGRILRAVNQPNQDIDTFLDVEPVVSDNIEVGLDWASGPFEALAAYFLSKSDKGARLQLVGGVYEVEREKTKIDGFEMTVKWNTPLEGLSFSGGYAMLNGRVDTNDDGTLDQDLDGANISPDRLNLAVDYATGPLGLRLQSRTYLDRDFDGVAPPAPFAGYTLFDAFTSYDTQYGDITLAVSNLLDKQYVTYNSQTVQNTSDTRFFAGRGRVISLSYEMAF